MAMALGLAGAPCQAQWWAKLALATEGHALAPAAKLAAKAGTAAAAAAELSQTAALLSRSSRLRAVEQAGAQFVLVDGRGAHAAVGVVAADGALSLSDDALRLLANVDLLVTQSQLDILKPLIQQAQHLRDDAVRLVRAEGPPARVRRVGDQWVAERSPGIFFPIDNAAAQKLASLLERPLDKTKTRVISLFDDTDADVLRALDDATGELHDAAGLVPAQKLRELLAAGRQRTLMVVGHIEGGSFVVRDAAGLVRNRIAIADLEAAAVQSESTLLLLGCGAGAIGRSAGFVGTVNALHVVKSLRAALDSTSLGDALSALARGSGDFVLHPGLEDALRAQWQLDRITVRPGTGPLDRAAILAPSVARQAELEARVVPGIPSEWQKLYAAGWVVLVACGRGAWRRWRSTWRPAPSFRRKPFTFAAVYGTRYGSFLLLMPIVFLGLLILCLGTWGLGLLALGSSLPAAATGGYFGLMWYRAHSDLVSDEYWFMRWLAFPIFVVALATPVDALMALASRWTGADLAAAGWSVSPGWMVAQALVAWVLGQLITRWLPARRWVPSRLFKWLLEAPLAVIERAAAGWWWTRSAVDAKH